MKYMIIKIFFIISMISVSLFAPAVLTALDRVVDNAGILSAGEKQVLVNKIAELSSKYKFDLVIVTEKSINKGYEAYADDFFDDNGYGFGQERDGCLILQIINDRYVQLSTSGRGIGILNSYAEDKLLTDVTKYLKANSYYGAYYSYLRNWETFLMLEEQGGRSYNFFYRWNFLLVAISWAVAFLIGLTVISVWKGKMNTAIKQTQANAYIIPGSLMFDQKTDRFLYSTVSKTSRETSTSGGGRSGGTRTSSSGRSHGGGGRRY